MLSCHGTVLNSQESKLPTSVNQHACAGEPIDEHQKNQKQKVDMLSTAEGYIQHLSLSVSEISKLVETDDIAREEKNTED